VVKEAFLTSFSKKNGTKTISELIKSSASGPSAGLTRRDFLKYTAVAVATAMAAGAFVWFLKPTEERVPMAPKKLKTAFIPSTPIEEPWVGVIHHALLKAQEEFGIEYDYTENVPYSDIPRVAREYAGRGFNVIFADVFGCEEEIREVAKDFLDVYFVLGSGAGPVEPNVCVFDDWIHEPAYICGMIAGKLTDSDVLGVVGGYAIPEVNRLINAFKYGAKEVNPDVKVKITFIESWFDPPKAKEAATSQIDMGADVIYAERYGPMEVCKERRIPCFGNLLDQWEEAPEVVITGPEWDMWPTVKEVFTSILEDRWQARDLAEWSMMAKGGAKLAGWPGWHNYEERLYPEIVEKINKRGIIEMVDRRIKEILNGTFRVPVDEATPISD